jgi:signal-transduction protein with cAMP-binding, CBS, and nucleotidyltransferase domain
MNTDGKFSSNKSTIERGEDMSTVAKIMSKQPKTVGPAVSIVSAAKKMKTARVGSLFVKKGRKLVGIVTDTDIVRRAVSANKPLGKMTVEKIMTTPICTIEGSQSVDDAQDMMGDLGVRHLAVTQAGEIVGVVSVRDVLRFYKRYAQSKVPAEAPYSEPKIFQD